MNNMQRTLEFLEFTNNRYTRYSKRYSIDIVAIFLKSEKCTVAKDSINIPINIHRIFVDFF